MKSRTSQQLADGARRCTHSWVRLPADPQELGKAGGTAAGDGEPLKHTHTREAMQTEEERGGIVEQDIGLPILR